MPKKQSVIFWSSLTFVFGFSLAFTLMGASATSLGKFLITNKILFSEIAGVIVIILGLHLMGALRGIKFLNFLYQEKRVQVTHKPPGLLGAFLMGLAFAVGWTPCIGPFLGAALTLAAEKNTVIQGMILLFTFSLGLGIPFLITSLAIGLFFTVFSKIKHYFHWIELLGGGLLIIIGIMLVSGEFTKLAALAGQFSNYGSLGPNGNNLSLITAFLAGTIAFFSPCVLPLIPGYISYISGVSVQELQKTT